MKKVFAIFLTAFLSILCVAVFGAVRDNREARNLYELKTSGKRAEFVHFYKDASRGAKRIYSRICMQERNKAEQAARLTAEAVKVYERN